MSSLKGKILIAAPNLFDFFRRTVVLVVEHNDQGAFGVVLNRRRLVIPGWVYGWLLSPRHAMQP